MEEVSMAKQRQGAGCHKSINTWKECNRVKKQNLLLLLDMLEITHIRRDLMETEDTAWVKSDSLRKHDILLINSFAAICMVCYLLISSQNIY